MRDNFGINRYSIRSMKARKDEFTIYIYDNHSHKKTYCDLPIFITYSDYTITVRKYNLIIAELNKDFDYYESQVMSFCYPDHLSIEPYQGMVWCRGSLNEEFKVLAF